MPHPLEAKYGLTAYELLDALDKRFRAKVTLEGAVAEVQMQKKIEALVGTVVERFETHDLDGYPDFSIWLPGQSKPLLAECKNVRDRDEAYRLDGRVVGFKVETQKTRAAKGDPSSRYYGVDQFDILGVCLGKKTGQWTDFVFTPVTMLSKHSGYPEKLSVMQRVPLPEDDDISPWYRDLGELLRIR